MRCPNCKITGDKNFYPSTLKRSGHNRLCKKCHSQKTNEYRKKNPEYPATYSKQYRARRPEYFKEYRKAYYQKYKQQILDHYGRLCVCCGEKDTRFLTLDHTNNDGYKHRGSTGFKMAGTNLYVFAVKNNFPAYFQLLCWNCNCGKMTNKGVCPHNL